MRKSRFSEEQIIAILAEAERGAAILVGLSPTWAYGDHLLPLAPEA